MRRRDHVGLTALMDAARLTGPPEPLASRLPARPAHQCGRPHRPRRHRRAAAAGGAIRRRPRAMAAELDRLNRERQAIEQQTLAEAEAEAMAALGLEEKGAVVVTAGHGWHPGVVGLVAARLKEQFGRPAFAIALEPGGIGTGSGRSIPGVDLGHAVREAVHRGLLTQGWRPCDGGRRDVAARQARAVPRLSGGDARRPGRGRAARGFAADRWRDDGRRRDGRAACRHRARRSLRRRPRRAGVRVSVAHASPMPRRSGRRMCARGCAPATAR